jgi:hypothetical protein
MLWGGTNYQITSWSIVSLKGDYRAIFPGLFEARKTTLASKETLIGSVQPFPHILLYCL